MDLKKREWVEGSGGGLAGGVAYLIYVLKGLPNSKWYKELLIFAAPVITLISYNVWRLLRPTMKTLVDYAIWYTKDWIRGKYADRIEKGLKKVLKNPIKKSEQVEAEDMLAELRIIPLRRALDEFKKMP